MNIISMTNEITCSALILFTFVVNVITAKSSSPATNLTCDVARLRCAYRIDCGYALQNYMRDCIQVITGNVTVCPTACLKALIELTSTETGAELMNCDCDQSEFCLLSKQRIEICRSGVLEATDESANVSCTIAKWICSADYQCSTALRYYNAYCQRLFQGKYCTQRCNNSLSILNRQTKAAKLSRCYCDGSEDFPCAAIRANTLNLCYSDQFNSNRIDNSIDENHDERELRDHIYLISSRSKNEDYYYNENEYGDDSEYETNPIEDFGTSNSTLELTDCRSFILLVVCLLHVYFLL